MLEMVWRREQLETLIKVAQAWVQDHASETARTPTIKFMGALERLRDAKTAEAAEAAEGGVGGEGSGKKLKHDKPGSRPKSGKRVRRPSHGRQARPSSAAAKHGHGHGHGHGHHGDGHAHAHGHGQGDGQGGGGSAEMLPKLPSAEEHEPSQLEKSQSQLYGSSLLALWFPVGSSTCACPCPYP